MRGVVTAEEHSIIGGVGAVVTHSLRGGGVPIELVGMPDVFGQSAHGYDELLEYYGLTAQAIANAVLKTLGMA